jgi:hypothetical protein
LKLQVLPREGCGSKGSRIFIIWFWAGHTAVYIIKCKWRGLYTKVRQSSSPCFSIPFGCSS